MGSRTTDPSVPMVDPARNRSCWCPKPPGHHGGLPRKSLRGPKRHEERREREKWKGHGAALSLVVVAGSGAGRRARKEAVEELRWPAGARVVGASGARALGAAGGGRGNQGRRWLEGGDRQDFWIGDAQTDWMGIDPDVGDAVWRQRQGQTP